MIIYDAEMVRTLMRIKCRNSSGDALEALAVRESKCIYTPSRMIVHLISSDKHIGSKKSNLVGGMILPSEEFPMNRPPMSKANSLTLALIYLCPLAT